MRSSSHKVLFWLLMLTLAVGPVQGVQALGALQPAMTAACLKMMAEHAAADPGAPGMDHAVCARQPASCPDMDGCAGFSGFHVVVPDVGSPLRSTLPLRLRLFGADARLTTRYPDLLQRPPRI